jgi:hypothetical protein
MVERRFKIAEDDFSRLRKMFIRGEISREQFAESLRQIRLIDDEGKCWMIGAQTGKWYYYDGKNWIKSEPPEDGKDFLICPVCDSYNSSESKVCSNCGTILVKTATEIVCPQCGSLIDSEVKVCPFCGTEIKRMIDERLDEKLVDSGQSLRKSEDQETWFLRSVDQLSFLSFFGGLGIFLGILSGLIIGSTEFFPDLVSTLPAFFKEIQGKLLGGLVFSVLGGILGFVLAAAFGFLVALLINASIYFLGGPKLRLEKTRGKSFKTKSKIF